MREGSNYIYRYLNSSWDFMPNKDKDRFAELWKGYEQVWADVLQKFYEADQSLNIESIPVFTTSRWNQYRFSDDNQVIERASFQTFQDLSLGVDLSERWILRVQIDENSPVEIDCRGAIASATSIQEIANRINVAVGFNFAQPAFENTILRLRTVTTGPNSKIRILRPLNVQRDATEIITGLTSVELPFLTPRQPFKFRLPGRNIFSIPSMQDSIRVSNQEYYIIEGPDYSIDRRNRTISFKEQPPENLWAQSTRLNEETPFSNFGWLIDYNDTSISREEYLRNVQGLWYAFWQGPRPELIRRSLYLLFGLPVSVRNGVVISRTDRIMEVLHDDNVIRSYIRPDQLNWLVGTGEYLERFQPLVSGIDVFDKVNLPGFIRTEVGRNGIQQFALPEATRGLDPETDESKALEVLEEHSFLPQINVNAFIRPNIDLGTVFSFLRSIKPLHKAFYFQVIVAVFEEQLDMQDSTTFRYAFDVTPNLDLNQTTYIEEFAREAYEDEVDPSTALALDSDIIGLSDSLTLEVSDFTGILPQFGVTLN